MTTTEHYWVNPPLCITCRYYDNCKFNGNPNFAGDDTTEPNPCVDYTPKHPVPSANPADN